MINSINSAIITPAELNAVKGLTFQQKIVDKAANNIANVALIESTELVDKPSQMSNFKSNEIDLVKELTNMITAQRTYEANAIVIKIADEMFEITLNIKD